MGFCEAAGCSVDVSGLELEAACGSFSVQYGSHRTLRLDLAITPIWQGCSENACILKANFLIAAAYLDLWP